MTPFPNSKINSVLAVDKQAVAMVVVESAKGYENFLRAMPSSTRIFIPVFHGSGGGDSVRVRIWGTSRTDWGLQEFLKFTTALIPSTCSFQPIYCQPEDSIFRKDFGPEFIARYLGVK